MPSSAPNSSENDVDMKMTTNLPMAETSDVDNKKIMNSMDNSESNTEVENIPLDIRLNDMADERKEDSKENMEENNDNMKGNKEDCGKDSNKGSSEVDDSQEAKNGEKMDKDSPDGSGKEVIYLIPFNPNGVFNNFYPVHHFWPPRFTPVYRSLDVNPFWYSSDYYVNKPNYFYVDNGYWNGAF